MQAVTDEVVVEARPRRLEPEWLRLRGASAGSRALMHIVAIMHAVDDDLMQRLVSIHAPTKGATRSVHAVPGEALNAAIRIRSKDETMVTRSVCCLS